MAFADNLKVLRKYSNLTQKELAERAGVSYSSIINYENRRREPPLSILKKIASALGTDVELLTASAVYVKDGVLIGEKTNEYGEVTSSWIVSDHANRDEAIIEHMWDITKRTAILRISKAIDKLNEVGINEAVKRVWELTEIPKYTGPAVPDE